MADAAPPLADERAIVQAFQALIQERDALGASVIERREEAAEHDLVLRTLEPLDGGRRCHRLVGDVLVARSVADVLPAVHTNHDNLLAVVQSLEKALQAKQKEVLAFQQKYNIRIRGEGIGEQAARDDAAAAAGNSSSTTTSAQKQGILVD